MFESANHLNLFQVKRKNDGSMEREVLVTSDRNTDAKFRFLSEATRPDYREVEKREDFAKVKMELAMQQKMSERLSMGLKLVIILVLVVYGESELKNKLLTLPHDPIPL